VHTHRLRPDDPPALADAVAQVHAECADASDDPREGGAVHRLDQGTSGVVAFARSRHAWRRAREHINSPEVEKLYLARSVPPQVSLPNLVSWPPPSTWAHPDPTPLPHLPAWLSARVPRAANPATVVRAPLASQGPRVVVRVDARGATSVVWPLAQANDGAWLLLVALRSGARHQARVHLATLGVPVVGDPLYGPHTGPWAARSAPSERLYLHALVLDLGRAEHTPMRVEAPVEDSFVGTLTGVRPWEAPGSRGA
jgi:23S rRNA pseudouridine1911/1915/1917 synthase